MKHVNIHVIQSIPPSVPNRDKSNEPKFCFYGGVERMRISSQCWGHGQKEYIKERTPEKCLAKSTRHVISLIVDLLGDSVGDAEKTLKAVRSAFILGTDGDIKIKDNDMVTYLMFLSSEGLNKFAEEVRKNADVLVKIYDDAFYKKYFDPEQKEKVKNKKKDKKDKADKAVEEAVKTVKKDKVVKEIACRLNEYLFSTEECVSLLLRGRMVTDMKQESIKSSQQMSHIIGVSDNSDSITSDYFGAIDDFVQSSDSLSGAGHINEQTFVSSVVYRYLAIDLDNIAILSNNDKCRQKDAIHKSIESFLCSYPVAKQASYASRTKPAYILISIHDTGNPTTFHSAFEVPIDPISKEAGEKLVSFATEAQKRWDGFEGDNVQYLFNGEESLDVPEAWDVIESAKSFIDTAVESAMNLLEN
jgi:CRISPR system Cascade subunit CasC